VTVVPTTRRKLRLDDCDEDARLLLGAASSLALDTFSEQAITSVHVLCAAFDQMPDLAFDLSSAHVSREALLNILKLNRPLPQLSELMQLTPEGVKHRAAVRTLTPRRLVLGLVRSDSSLRRALSQCGADIDDLEELLGRKEGSHTRPGDEFLSGRDEASAGMYTKDDLGALSHTRRGARLARIMLRLEDKRLDD
jgi:hypothetical protein